jgi:hypothetical protein
MPWATYEYARGCTGSARPGAVALMSWINKNYPKSKNWGIYSCRIIPGSNSMSLHGEGRALDVGFAVVDGKGNPEGYKLFAHLKAHALELGIQGIIWDRKISTNRGDNRPYSGSTLTLAHVDHLHVELTNAASRGLTTAKIAQVMGSPPSGEDFGGGDFGGGTVDPAATAGLLDGLKTLTDSATWIRVGMFAGGALLIVLGLVALNAGGIKRLTTGNVAQSVKSGIKTVTK